MIYRNSAATHIWYTKVAHFTTDKNALAKQA